MAETPPMPPGFAEPADWRARIAALSPARAATLAERARTAPLFAHAYAFHLNFRFGAMQPRDLLAFAEAWALTGVKIHVEDGEDRALCAMTDSQLRAFGAEARARGLDLHVETSSTTPADLSRTAAIAHATGASSMRFYPRHSGPLSQVLAASIADLAILDRLDPEGRLHFTLEQHEDLTSADLVRILDQVGHPRLSLLFDFGNMINAHETPLAALSRQAPFVTEVHIKDAIALPDRTGWAHRACATGQGHLPMRAMLVELLLLGQDAPQIRAFALEEEEDYLAPAFRFPDEGPDPVIPPRGPSATDPGPGPLPARLAQEAASAAAQVQRVRAMLHDIAAAARAVTPSSR
jgi:sugar phosphate isomerase/epimerase